MTRLISKFNFMKPRYIVFLLLFLIILIMAISNSFFKNNVHEWRYDGKCKQCHSQHEHIKNEINDIKPALLIPPPKSHNEQFRRYTHGRTENFSYQRCASCHIKSECESCHNTLPESHTSDFVNPSGNGLERHIMLASINPSSCLTCHKSFVVACVECHTASEVKPWQEAAENRPQGTMESPQ
ncbi:MAG: hypothetical protein OQK46_07860 [Gammaproteobacteria bacterium]|nr:hypothetical protein [Gammaproteobacteria bacterium]